VIARGWVAGLVVPGVRAAVRIVGAALYKY